MNLPNLFPCNAAGYSNENIFKFFGLIILILIFTYNNPENSENG